MKRFEILDLIEDLGFQHLADMLLLSAADFNNHTYMDCIEHLNRCKNECTELEFSLSLYHTVIGLLDLYFSL
jgi:hypothetical protein